MLIPAPVQFPAYPPLVLTALIVLDAVFSLSGRSDGHVTEYKGVLNKGISISGPFAFKLRCVAGVMEWCRVGL